MVGVPLFVMLSGLLDAGDVFVHAELPAFAKEPISQNDTNDKSWAKPDYEVEDDKDDGLENGSR